MNTHLFGTIATLNEHKHNDIVKSAGFIKLHPNRTSIYRNAVFLRVWPTDNHKHAYRRVLQTSLNDALSLNKGPRLRKMIFYVKRVRDTIDLYVSL